MPQTEELTVEDTLTVEEFQQFLKWAGEPGSLGPFVPLAAAWYSGLLTIEEGQRIEHKKQVWQTAMNW